MDELIVKEKTSNENKHNALENGMEYNTERSGIVLSQYGRNIHKLVEYAMGLPSKEDRLKASHQIIIAMEILNPKIRVIDDYKKVLWNHLAIMSGFNLDIEYPYDIIQKEEMLSKPEQILLQKGGIKKRQYGRIITDLIKKAIEVEDEDVKKEFIEVILIQMKRIYIDWNKDVVNDVVIFDDFLKLSDNKLTIPVDFKLPQSYEIRNKFKNSTISSTNPVHKKPFKKRIKN
jgi:hypothetical protein